MSWFRKKKNKESDDQSPGIEKPAPNEQEAIKASEEMPDVPDTVPIEEVSDNKIEAESGYFSRLKQKLSKSRRNLSDGLDKIFFGDVQLNDLVLEDLEELLITSDIGVETSMDLIGRIAKGWEQDQGKLRTLLRKEILALLTKNPALNQTV